MNSDLKTLLKTWPRVEEALSVYKTRKQYSRGVRLMEEVLSIVGTDSKHTMYPILEILSVLVEDYERANFAEPQGCPIEVLEYLMNEHGLSQKDLKSELGSQGTVSEILSGKRELNKRQIIALSKRFGVSPMVFLDSEDSREAA